MRIVDGSTLPLNEPMTFMTSVLESAAMVDNHPKSRLLDGLDENDIRVILQAAKEQRYVAVSLIASQAHRANKLFLLLDGQARHFYLTEDGQKVLLRWLVPGDITGAAALSVPLQH